MSGWVTPFAFVAVACLVHQNATGVSAASGFKSRLRIRIGQVARFEIGDAFQTLPSNGESVTGCWREKDGTSSQLVVNCTRSFDGMPCPLNLISELPSPSPRGHLSKDTLVDGVAAVNHATSSTLFQGLAFVSSECDIDLGKFQLVVSVSALTREEAARRVAATCRRRLSQVLAGWKWSTARNQIVSCRIVAASLNASSSTDRPR